MAHSGNLAPTKTPLICFQNRACSVLLVLVASVFFTVSQTLKAQEGMVVQVGNATVDSERTNVPRWSLINSNPLTSGTHTIRIAWDSNEDLRFSLFQALTRSDRVLVAPTSNAPTPDKWTGTLDGTEQYYLGVWAASREADFIATIDAAVEITPLGLVSQPADLTTPEGEVATFIINAIGSGVLEHPWFANDMAIPGATAHTVLRANKVPGTRLRAKYM